jgi:hypothetical protein
MPLPPAVDDEFDDIETFAHSTAFSAVGEKTASARPTYHNTENAPSYANYDTDLGVAGGLGATAKERALVLKKQRDLMKQKKARQLGGPMLRNDNAFGPNSMGEPRDHTGRRNQHEPATAKAEHGEDAESEPMASYGGGRTRAPKLFGNSEEERPQMRAGSSDADAERSRLGRELSAAVDAQDFMRAAQLKNELDNLDAPSEPACSTAPAATANAPPGNQNSGDEDEDEAPPAYIPGQRPTSRVPPPKTAPPKSRQGTRQPPPPKQPQSANQSSAASRFRQQAHQQQQHQQQGQQQYQPQHQAKPEQHRSEYDNFDIIDEEARDYDTVRSSQPSKSAPSKREEGSRSRDAFAPKSQPPKEAKQAKDEVVKASKSATSKKEPVLPQILDLKKCGGLHKFLTNPCPKHMGTVQCYILRNRSGLNKLKPTYTLFVEEKHLDESTGRTGFADSAHSKRDESGGMFLMYSQRTAKSKTPHYSISARPKSTAKGDDAFMGKVRGNFDRSEYQIFDDGVSPKDSPPGSETRQERGFVALDKPGLLTKNGCPRSMKVAIPKVDSQGEPSKWVDGADKCMQSEFEACLQKELEPEAVDLTVLMNKPPRFNEKIGEYCLNFHGRVTHASVKNFQLVDQNNRSKILLQFGRVGKDKFTCDFSYPLSPYQAFSIVLTNFDCE